MNSIESTRIIKNIAKNLGFSYCGISEANYLDEEAPRLEKWLKNGYQAKMHYMENYFDKRLDPRVLVPGSKSVISLLFNYYPKKYLAIKNNYKISKYAFGKDYHYVIKKKLNCFIIKLQEKIGAVEGRFFVDSAPVLERVWAKKSGLGWIGKNTLLITKQHGSFFFLSQLIIDLPLLTDSPIKDYCGTCTKCIEACPTQALTPYHLDANKCISYLTIELKDNIPKKFNNQLDSWIFGCDICQDVCPWNRFSIAHNFEDFKPSESLLAMRKKDWDNLDEKTFSKLFKKSAVKRAKFKGFQRNINVVKQSKQRYL